MKPPAFAMKARPESLPDTKQRLLDAASRVFVEQGFARSKIRDIVARANTNLAAVNYHFGSKERLYDAVLRHHAQRIMTAHPTHLVPGFEALSTDEKLRVFIRGVIGRILDDDPATVFPRLVAQEMLDPTPALDGMIEAFVRPQAAVLIGIVATLLDIRRNSAEARRCALSVIGQCLNLYFQRHVIHRVFPEQRLDHTAIDELAAHVATFSLGGIEAVARRRRSGRSGPRGRRIA